MNESGGFVSVVEAFQGVALSCRISDFVWKVTGHAVVEKSGEDTIHPDVAGSELLCVTFG